MFQSVFKFPRGLQLVNNNYTFIMCNLVINKAFPSFWVVLIVFKQILVIFKPVLNLSELCKCFFANLFPWLLEKKVFLPPLKMQGINGVHFKRNFGTMLRIKIVMRFENIFEMNIVFFLNVGFIMFVYKWENCKTRNLTFYKKCGLCLSNCQFHI